MPDERARVLELLREGKITVEEAERLLDALGPVYEQAESAGEPSPGGWPGAPPPPPPPPRPPRRLCIRITDLRTGKVKTNVRVPFAAWGFLSKLTRTRLGRHLSRLGIHDIQRFVREGTTGHIVDVTDDNGGERVEIFFE